MAVPCTATINSLDDDVLGEILLLLPSIDRAGPVPRVCRRWHRITAHPSMWPTVDMTPRHPSVVAWLQKRSLGLRHFTLHLQRASINVASGLVAILPAATQLQQLQLPTEDAEIARPFDIRDLAGISHLRGLTSLQIAFIDTPFHAASLDTMLACLAALEVVSLGFCKASGLAWPWLRRLQPQDAIPCSLLRCTRLTSLDFNASYPWLPTCSVPAGITVLQCLQHLGLRNCVTTPLPRSLSQLSRLTSLDVTQPAREYRKRLFLDRDGPVPLPTSLQALDATVAPVESFCQLRALQHLGLSQMVDKPSDPSFLTMLQQLTSLQLDVADLEDWSVFEGCTGLRTLHLGELKMEEPRPLAFQQLTRLQLENSRVAASAILVLISEMPQLEVVEFKSRHGAFELLGFDVTALSRLPKLRLVDLSGSKLWSNTSRRDAVRGQDMRYYLPLRVVHHLMCLQRANPDVEWVLRKTQGQVVASSGT